MDELGFNLAEEDNKNLDEFKRTYKISGQGEKVPESILQKYAEDLPQILIDLWKEEGWGNYNNGLIQTINPEEYKNTLWTWLGREVDNYTPFALDGFGNLFYYRKLTETDEDVCMLLAHYRSIETVSWSLGSFFNSFLCDDEMLEDLMWKSLHEEAVKKLGENKINESFHFAPALAIGGAPELSFVEKGNTIVHLDILFQMGN